LKISFFIFIIYFLTSILSASVNINSDETDILNKCVYSLDDKNISPTNFSKIQTNDLNFGITHAKKLTIKCDIYNQTNKTITKVLELKNPLLQRVDFYQDDLLLIVTGSLHKSNDFNINSHIDITLKANSSSTISILAYNETTALRASLFLKKQSEFLNDDYVQQNFIYVFLGIIIALMLYNTLLYFYTKDNAYIFYALYILSLIYQQLTYLGITPILFSPDFTRFDDAIVLFKVNIMYILASMFAISFLKTFRFKKIDFVYKFLIIIAILEIFIFSSSNFYYPEVGILTGLIFVIFNIFSASYIYLAGYKEARLFVFSWSILVIGFILMILDGLGLISIMPKFPNLIMYSTAFEAMLLSLAFTDKYVILKTSQIQNSLNTKALLFKELHHRTKNNLQLILSIVKMYKHKNTSNELQSIEKQIISIAKSHELLYFNQDLQEVTAYEYFDALIDDLLIGVECDINLDTDVALNIEESVYIGLILNELLSNSIKHTFGKDDNFLSVSLNQVDDKYIFTYKDNSKGFLIDKSKQTLGLSLIDTLANEQLDATTSFEHEDKLLYTIIWKVT